MTTTPYMIGKPFWQSRTIIGAVVVILAVALRHMGWEVDQGKLSDDISAGLELLGAILAFYGRIKADQPIVWTRGTVPGGAFNPEAEVRKAAPVQPPATGPLPSSIDPRRSSGYAYIVALGMLSLCIFVAGILISCAPTADFRPPKSDLPMIHHPSLGVQDSGCRVIAADLLRSLRVTPSVDVTTNRAGKSIPVVTVNVMGGVEF